MNHSEQIHVTQQVLNLYENIKQLDVNMNNEKMNANNEKMNDMSTSIESIKKTKMISSPNEKRIIEQWSSFLLSHPLGYRYGKNMFLLTLFSLPFWTEFGSLFSVFLYYTVSRHPHGEKMYKRIVYHQSSMIDICMQYLWMNDCHQIVVDLLCTWYHFLFFYCPTPLFFMSVWWIDAVLCVMSAMIFSSSLLLGNVRGKLYLIFFFTLQYLTNVWIVIGSFFPSSIRYSLLYSLLENTMYMLICGLDVFSPFQHNTVEDYVDLYHSLFQTE